MTDTPKHYTVSAVGFGVSATRYYVAEDPHRWYRNETEAVAACEAHRAAVVADSPELAQARERIAALEAEAKTEAEARASATWTAVVLVTERDAALARVAELEALVAEMKKPDPLQEKIDALTRRVLDAAQPKPRDESVPAPGWTICDEDRGKYIRDGGLTDKAGTWLAYDAEHGYEAAAQPKPRDESVPPPGWVWLLDRFPGDTSGKVVREEGGRVRSLAEAWAKYDAEHGYAPDDARIRADERSKCAAELRAQAEHYAVGVDTPPNSDERHAAITEAVILLSAAKRMDGTDPGIVRRSDPREGT